jgi:DNA segregation ATPase FtsK/SpoIIIE-like protein
MSFKCEENEGNKLNISNCDGKVMLSVFSREMGVELPVIISESKARALAKQIQEGCYMPELYDESVDFVRETNRASISSIQRKFRIGYNHAAQIMDLMEKKQVVSLPDRQGIRTVLRTS